MMAKSSLLADLDRALQLLEQVDDYRLGFAPDPTVSADIQGLTGLEKYPTETHLGNVRARLDAVIKAGDRLAPRGASDYLSRVIVTCVRLAPRSDD
jgi:hypothetical protein